MFIQNKIFYKYSNISKYTDIFYKPYFPSVIKNTIFWKYCSYLAIYIYKIDWKIDILSIHKIQFFTFSQFFLGILSSKLLAVE